MFFNLSYISRVANHDTFMITMKQQTFKATYLRQSYASVLFFFSSRSVFPRPQQSNPHHLHMPYLKQQTRQAGTQHTHRKMPIIIAITQNISPIDQTVLTTLLSMPVAIGSSRYVITPQMGVSNSTVARNPLGSTVHTRHI